MPIQLLSSSPAVFVLWLLAIVFGITVHEFGHALAATMLGDPTARDKGRLTLNPVAHIDLFGFLMLLFAGFGWGKPTPFNPYNLRIPRWGPAIVGMAGPAMNLVFVAVFGLAFRLIANALNLGPENYLMTFLVLLIQINVILLVFNLLPIPPLDGSKVLFSILPAHMDEFRARFEQQGPFLLLMLIIADNFLGINIFGRIFGAIFDAVLNIIFA